MRFGFRAVLLVLPFLLAAPKGLAFPDGLYTTTAAERGAPTPVGYNNTYESGFTLRPGPGWRLAQPILPLDFSLLKPWIETPGIRIRVRRLRSDASTAAEAARTASAPGNGFLSRLGDEPFAADSGLQGARVRYGLRGKSGSATTREVFYFFPNGRGALFVFEAELRATPPDPKAADELMKTLATAKRLPPRPPGSSKR